jgi:lipopolysaccharide biosynthesis regulator YciM
MMLERFQYMSDKEMREEKKGKRRPVACTEDSESQNISKLLETLEKLRKQGKYVDIQICPRCKSPQVKRVGTMNGDMLAHRFLTSPKFECRKCGWRGRLVLEATNRPEKKINF